jgi:high-affinity Fe2+/Pb2+ permease
MLLAVVITGLLLLIVLAVLIGLALREHDEVRSRPSRYDDDRSD